MTAAAREREQRESGEQGAAVGHGASLTKVGGVVNNRGAAAYAVRAKRGYSTSISTGVSAVTTNSAAMSLSLAVCTLLGSVVNGSA